MHTRSTLTRRDVLAAAGAGAALGLAPRTLPAMPSLAHGFVFEADGDRMHRRPRDRGIAGVMVSNGRDVVPTGADGSWSLPVREGHDIFVIKPPHWMAPRGGGGIARIMPRIARDGEAPVLLDFPLVRREEAASFQALLVTDTQPDSHEELTYVRDDIIAGFMERPAAFGIHHGDVVGDNLGLYPRYLSLLEATGIPWHHCSGNHDIDRRAADDLTSRETWRRTFGPRHYAFQHAGAIFFVLDNVRYLGAADGRYVGRLGAEQLEFVRNVLAHVPADLLVVLSMHIPLRCHLDPENPADTTSDYLDLLRLLDGRPHTVSFAGHLHATEHHYLDVPSAGGHAIHHHHVLTAASGSWWSGPRDHRGIPSADSTDGTPNGFHVLSVEGTSYATAFVPATGKRTARLRASIACASQGTPSCGLTVNRGMIAQSRLVVNVFDGGPRTRVRGRFRDQERWTDLAAVVMEDPFVCRLFAGDTPRKDWVKPTLCSHIWTMPLAQTLGPGAHRVSLQIVDEYGRASEERVMLEVMDA